MLKSRRGAARCCDCDISDALYLLLAKRGERAAERTSSRRSIAEISPITNRGRFAETYCARLCGVRCVTLRAVRTCVCPYVPQKGKTLIFRIISFENYLPGTGLVSSPGSPYAPLSTARSPKAYRTKVYTRQRHAHASVVRSRHVTWRMKPAARKRAEKTIKPVRPRLIIQQIKRRRGERKMKDLSLECNCTLRANLCGNTLRIFTSARLIVD